MKTVTIGISAHNEEKNIGNLLDGIMEQERSYFVLKSVVIACDGCSDNTANIVNLFIEKYRHVSMINDGKRIGKAKRLNVFYKQNISDIFISLDADVVLANKNVINEIVKKFDNTNVGLVGGSSLPFPPKNFFEKIIYTWLLIWIDMKNNVGEDLSVHNHLGCISAVSKKLAQKITIPNNIIPDDDFVFFTAIKHGFHFSFAKKATVYYRTVDNLKDFLIQHNRLINSKKYVFDFFGEWTKSYYVIPRTNKIASILRFLIHEPLFTLLALALQILLRKGKFMPEEKYENGFWTVASSSKELS